VADIYFRHESLRQYQEQLVQDVYSSVKDGCHLLAHAPTGLGKTDSVLGASLTYALQNDLTVFFLTPKISQHKIAMEVVNGIAKKHELNIRAVDLIGRRYSCIDRSLSDLDHEGFYLSCEKKRKNETCEFYKRGKGYSKLDEAKANVIFEKVLKDYGVSKTHAELMKLGEQHMTCPYEWMIKLAGASNVIVADYYHLMIPKIREIFLKKTKKRLDKSIVIIDEAHNLAKRVREQLSSTINSFIIQRAEKEMRFVGTEKIEIFSEFNKWAKTQIKEEKEIAVSKAMFNEFIATYGMDKESLAYNFDVIGLEFIERANKKSMCMKIAKFLRSWDSEEKGCLRILKRRGSGYVLSKRFLDPSVSTSELNKTHSAILMSGTLMPLEMHRDVLGLDEMRTNLRVYRSPFDEENSLNIICDSTTTRYSKRDFDNYKKMAMGIDQIIEATPDSEGVAVFFPSYNVMNSIVPLLKPRGLLLQKEKMTPTEISELLHEFTKGGVLCGVQGGSLSVDYDEPIIIRRKGIISIEKIGEVVDRIMDKNTVTTRNGIERCNPIEKHEVPAFDPKNFKISFKPISRLIRHRIKEPLCEIKLQTGRSVRVTRSHSVFALKNGKLCAVEVSNLKKGDYLVIPNILPSGNIRNEIDLTSELLKLPNSDLNAIYARGLGRGLDLNLLKKRGLNRHWKYRATAPLSLLKEGVWEKTPQIGKIHTRWGNSLPGKIALSKELFRLLGYYVAEGHQTSGRHSAIGLTFGLHEEHIVEDVKHCIEAAFAVKPWIRKEKHYMRIQVGGKLIRLLITNILKAGHNAHTKRVPPIVFSAPDEMKLEFIKGYFAGDGTASKESEISFKTVSRILASDLMYLLLQLGLTAGCSLIHPGKRGGEAYQVFVSNSTQLQKLLPVFEDRIKKRIMSHIEKSKRNKKRRTLLPIAIPIKESGFYELFCEANPTKGPKFARVGNRILQETIRRDLAEETLEYIIKERISSIDRKKVEFIRKIINSDFGFARIREIKETHSTSQYVYDISVEGNENFVGGFGGVVLHNSEGVDYCKGEIKTAIIVGIALEEPSLETEALIDYYQDKFGKGWEYGYMYPAVIKALQAAGRGIRKESDRSAIVFMDERFKWKNYKSILDDGRRFIITREPEAFVRNFWRGEGVRI
jgi:Rad3-related DNA helicase/intein/homing endonuclease